MIHITLLPGAALVAASLAAVQGGAPQRPDPNADVTRAQVIERVDQRFARLDANNDGRFTREEGQAMRERRRTELANRVFDRVDADHNGSITREEMSQARAQRQARRGERMAGGPGMRGPGGPGMRGARMHRMRGAMAMRMFGEQGFITRDQLRQHAL
ncbi:MAG TPA: EF-hand domain-containing protein, partial [Allosphingosinicella sp.]|nr:EF-hand domain-containing protein [Allosphingosinicella sp.]